MSKSKPSSNGFTLFNLAKKLTGLKSSEKRVAVAMADKIRKVDGVCNASLGTLASEFGGSERDFQYGLHGRRAKEKNGNLRCRFPGVLARGLFIVAEEHTNPKNGRKHPTVYRACLDNWKPFLPEQHHEWFDRVKGEQQRANSSEVKGEPCPPERVNHLTEKGEPLTEKGCKCAPNTLIETLLETQKPTTTTENMVEAVGWLTTFYGQTKKKILAIDRDERAQLEALAERDGLEVFQQTCEQWIRARDTEGLVRVANKLIEEYDSQQAVARGEHLDRSKLAAEQKRADANKEYADRQAEQKQREVAQQIEAKRIAEASGVSTF